MVQIFDLEKAIEYLQKTYATSISTSHCAKAVREALEAGGVNTLGNPISAKDYGPFLEKKGFYRLSLPAGSAYVPRVGDIVVMQPPSLKEPSLAHGHVAICTGTSNSHGTWHSDFSQHDFWPGRWYRSNPPPFEIYRNPQVTTPTVQDVIQKIVGKALKP